MALYRKIKGQDTKVASNGIVYHNDLEGRNSYGAHSIDSIRKLPEKLTTINTRLKNLEDGKVSKDQIASREEAGLIWGWQTEKAGKPIFHIWTRKPEDIPEPEITENEYNGLTYMFASNNPCEIEENDSNGLTYKFGGNI